MARNGGRVLPAKELTRIVEYKDGKTWRTKKVSMHVNDWDEGLRLLEMSLNHQHGQKKWRYKKA